MKYEDLAEWGTRFIIPDSLIEPVVLTSMGNSIYRFFVKGDPDSVDNNTVTILYCHGRSDNVNRYWVRVEYLWEMGYNVFIFDYQGFGMSEGSPSCDALYSDGTAASEYVRSRPDVDADFDNEKRIHLVGSPLLMMHGRVDDYVVFDRHVPLLWDSAVEPKESLWVEGAGHDDIPEVLGPAYHTSVVDFIRQHILN